ncbi:hypothetical protein [Candidatus Burkholderia verschuerenii]|uniref:hypothetical protein n=1 Tax=Candidatus Burkholderia verschuerenii TaxID=242163 RepID=UPI000AF88235|nr:hypothetical protein [Candidatus Burkholderia verschuerenii]
MTRADEPAVLDSARRPVVAPVRHDSAHAPAPERAALASKRARSFSRLRADAARLRRALAVSTCVMVAWSLFEVPWEIDLSSSREQTAAVIASKTMLLLIAALSMRGRRWARYLLLFICLTSVLAIGPELPAEFDRAPWLAFLSSVECFAKLAVLLLLALYLRSGSKPLPLREPG